MTVALNKQEHRYIQVWASDWNTPAIITKILAVLRLLNCMHSAPPSQFETLPYRCCLPTTSTVTELSWIAWLAACHSMISERATPTNLSLRLVWDASGLCATRPFQEASQRCFYIKEEKNKKAIGQVNFDSDLSFKSGTNAMRARTSKVRAGPAVGLYGCHTQHAFSIFV